ncbi:hypothetical protein PF002_g14800 [Phytophthora fragariae]|uniref:Uncharacterized protein n=2 Tax=Phytophthora fragariae TaxID=53985 RepID=A0A6A3YTJ2_9STRA|nr:hypothetical protein PF003_g37174 [Phytophthora fragariae]KAE8935341.1 hypothetical protein PF009_g14702 [Phytophthora fragariae]KAE9004975.1 hypothetical protein PF011_g12232 [Phytophthora fragariae]KAE9105279.1 hypothetical protein PF007_g13754 [Phytophthora fragariae]KAE9224082.1 hypothetical protein PF002_g14800 [Phytophthora fragariae]
MERLPPPLFSSIVAYAVHDFSEDLVPTKRKLPVDNLKPLALVCKSWNSLVQDVVARFQSSRLSLIFSSGSRSESMEIRRRISQRGPKVVDLFVQIGDAPPRGGGVHFFRTGVLNSWTHKNFKINWDVLFAGLPALQRLDLSGVQLLSGHVDLILQSPAKYCKNIESVVLCDVDEMLQGSVDFDSIFAALFAAMEIWYSSGTNRGLRQLKVPSLNERHRFQCCKQLLDNLVKFSPGVEYVDGYKATLCEMDKLTCRDDWLITVEQWEEFNAKCTQLREFHWVVAPFADPFFRVFGQHVKPRLTKLTFGVNMLWDWEEYFDSLAEAAGEPLSQDFSRRPVRPGYGFKATDPSSALKGCPALEDLEIELYHPVDGDEMGYDDFDEDESDEFPDHEVLDIDIFGDQFCETLAKHCPLLTAFSIWEVAEGKNGNLTPIRTFTDRGLVALAQLKYLTRMELRIINCSGNGVFEFLKNLSDEFTGLRTFQICVGGHPSESRLAFYNVLSELLMQLETTTPEELSWGRRKFVLRLMNSNFDSVDPIWSQQYLRGLEPLVRNVKNMHPNMRFRITTSGRRGSTFRSIIELGIYTSNAEPSVWYGWDEEESNRDITFVNRGGETSMFEGGHNRLPVELRHPELLDPDSLPIDYELPADYFDDYGGYGDYGGYYDEDDDGFYDANADELWE